MPQAIRVKTIPATRTKGRRLAATSESGERVVIGWDHNKSHGENYRDAGWSLIKQLDWGDFGWHCGFFNGDAYFVCEVD